MDLIDKQDCLLSAGAGRFVAAAMTRRISATLLSTPLIRTNFAWVISAMTRASVVLPLPGGPEKITDGKRSASMARRKSFPGPRMCSWPTNSSRESGRIRVASGAAVSVFAAASRSSLANKSCTGKNTACPQTLHQILHRCGDKLTDGGSCQLPHSYSFCRTK